MIENITNSVYQRMALEFKKHGLTAYGKRSPIIRNQVRAIVQTVIMDTEEQQASEPKPRKRDERRMAVMVEQNTPNFSVTAVRFGSEVVGTIYKKKNKDGKRFAYNVYYKDLLIGNFYPEDSDIEVDAAIGAFKGNRNDAVRFLVQYHEEQLASKD